jgi:hypothetical protein
VFGVRNTSSTVPGTLDRLLQTQNVVFVDNHISEHNCPGIG